MNSRHTIITDMYDSEYIDYDKNRYVMCRICLKTPEVYDNVFYCIVCNRANICQKCDAFVCTDCVKTENDNERTVLFSR